ncbi:MAG: hypothetical protein CVV06_20645 [Gammaproteobacteria bacterium HGW-Gammaproteobacteria-10]|nr:MAG: hypothetical protein CVV06_20645 [Gammaproteobacteria bacterium HGW-Gammaproteobacteria-10]
MLCLLFMGSVYSFRIYVLVLRLVPTFKLRLTNDKRSLKIGIPKLEVENETEVKNVKCKTPSFFHDVRSPQSLEGEALLIGK